MNTCSKIRRLFLVAMIASVSFCNAAELQDRTMCEPGKRVKQVKDMIKPFFVAGVIGLLNSVYAAASQVSDLEEMRGDKCACVETTYRRILCAGRPDCCDGIRAAGGPCGLISMEEMAKLWWSFEE
jgi:hypothetical protein